MRTESIRSSVRFLRTLQLIGGIITTLLGVAIFLRILGMDANAPSRTPPDASGYVLYVLTLVAPGVAVLIGSFLQVASRRRLGMAVVFIGSISGFLFIGWYAGFLFTYAGDKWGQLAVLSALGAIVFTMGLAIANLAMPRSLDNRSQ